LIERTSASCSVELVSHCFCSIPAALAAGGGPAAHADANENSPKVANP
jgi:hypothetical protein